MWIDIHSHQQEFSKDNFDTPCLIKILENGSFPDSTADITDRKEKLIPAYGLHPWHISPEKYPVQLKQIFKLNRSVKSPLMGEIGLDKAVDKDFSLQKEVFIRQLEFAAGQGLICIIHCVRAFSEILSLRKKFCDSPPWIIHDFNSSPQMAADFIRRGCYLSFGKRIMQKNNRAYRCLRELPDNAGFFLETDVRNNYSIMDIYYAAAQIRRLDISKLRNKIIDNFQNCFKEYPCLMNG